MIMKLIAFLFVFLSGSVGLSAQTVKPKSPKPITSGAVSISSRYEIVEVRSKAVRLNRVVIRLDTYSGQTYWADQSEDAIGIWLKMDIEGLPTESASEMSRYRIHVFGDHAYLLNMETGQTWGLPNAAHGWKPFKGY
jgi:hypothetical protein